MLKNMKKSDGFSSAGLTLTFQTSQYSQPIRINLKNGWLNQKEYGDLFKQWVRKDETIHLSTYNI
jgi:hypothetical protein